MNAIELLVRQHRDLDSMIDRVANARSSRAKRAAFLRLAEILVAHIKIEEGVFYPAVLAKPTDEAVLDGLAEHLQIKRLLAEMRTLSVDDPRFDTMLAVIKRAHEVHTRDAEEDEVFVLAARLFSAPELAALGRTMELYYDDLLAAPPEIVTSEISTAMLVPALA
jgi:hypothetical protein